MTAQKAELRDPRFAELDPLLANDPQLAAWSVEKLLLKPWPVQRCRKPRRDRNRWRRRRAAYLAETGRMEVSRGR